MTKKDILCELKKFLKDEYNLEEVNENIDLINQMGLDSLDMINLSLFITNKFNICIQPSNIYDENRNLNLLVNKIFECING